MYTNLEEILSACLHLHVSFSSGVVNFCRNVFSHINKKHKKLADSTSTNLRFYPYKFTLVSWELLEILYVFTGAICRILKILKFIHIEEIGSSYPQNSVYFVYGIPSAYCRAAKNYFCSLFRLRNMAPILAKMKYTGPLPSETGTYYTHLAGFLWRRHVTLVSG
jgi:hypothetical protein